MTLSIFDYHRAYAAALGDVARAKLEAADLRDRLSLFAEHVCNGCGCAVIARVTEPPYCQDCERLLAYPIGPGVGACVSVGLRALCGRRILGGR